MSQSPLNIPGGGKGRNEGWGDWGESQSWNRPSGAVGRQDGLSGGSWEAAGTFLLTQPSLWPVLVLIFLQFPQVFGHPLSEQR